MNNSTTTIWQYASAKKDINTAAFILGTIFISVGFVGNFFTVIFIVRSKALHTPTYLTICCLAVADELASISRYFYLLPKSFQLLVVRSTRFYLYLTFSFLFMHSANFHITLLSYVRYLFLAKPLQSLEIDNKSILKLSGAIWILSLIVSAGYGGVLIVFSDDYTISRRVEFMFAMYAVGVPFVLVIYFHIKKMCYVYNQPLIGTRNNQITNRLSWMFLIIISIYLASNLYPLLCTISYMAFEPMSEVLMYVTLLYSHNVFHLFLLFNNCINPLIYFLFCPPSLRFLSQVRKLVCTCM